jgi:hypothetical protein
MAAHWDGLVLNDYEAVMPLTWRRKYGFYYLYQPYFIPSLGLFGKVNNSVTLHDFLSAIPLKFKYWDIKLNETNDVTKYENVDATRIGSCKNCLLKLDKSYEAISDGYKRLCVRMIKKATDQKVEVIRNVTPAEVIKFYTSLYQQKHKGISAAVYKNLSTFTTERFAEGHVKTYIARLPGGEVMAVYLLLVDRKFVYSLIGGSSEKGKKAGSFYLLTDAVIRDHADSDRIFRFEGSDIPGIAFFNAQFGAAAISYPRLIVNKLPFPLNILKR